jgi:hypothetical protein
MIKINRHVLGPDGLSRFEELRSREAMHAQFSMPSTSSSMAARTLAGLVQKASFPSGSTAAIDPVLVGSGSRCAIPFAVQPQRSEMWKSKSPQAAAMDRPVSVLMALRR